jgi:hypothetical protein
MRSAFPPLPKVNCLTRWRGIPALEAKVQSFLATVAVLSCDSLAAQKYGELSAHLEAIGHPWDLSIC